MASFKTIKMKKSAWLFYIIVIMVIDVFRARCLLAADIAVIKSNDIAPYNLAIQGFTQEIRDDVSEYDLGGKPGNIRKIMEKIKDNPPKLIFALGSLAAVEAKNSFPNIPIIYTLVFTPGNKELTAKNMTGIAIEVDGKEQLAVFKDIIPEIKKIGVLYSNLTEQTILKAVEDCWLLGLELVAVKVNRPEEVPEGIKKLAGRTDGLWLIPDGIVVNQDSLQYILLLTLENKIPFMVYNKNFVKAGALLAPVVDYTHVGRQAGKLGREALQGKELPNAVLPPAGVEWAVNFQTAQNLKSQISSQALASFKYIYK